MANAFSFKTYYNPYISPTTNSVWGVVSVTANQAPQEAQGAVISLICDVSGSMQGAKFNNAIATVEDLLEHAPNGIMLQVVVFDDDGKEVVPMTNLTPAVNRAQLVSQFRSNLKRVQIFGGTSMSTGIDVALQAQRQITGGYARYGIFLSDGQSTEPESHLARAVKAAADMQIHLCAYGYGSDWNPSELTKMAQITNGWMPKAVPQPEALREEFATSIVKMANTVASDVALNLWTPTGARILSLSQAYPDWVKGEAAPMGDDHTWVVPVPPMSTKDHRDFIVHVELASVGARVVAMKPSVVYVAGGQRIEEKGDQTTWMILEQTHETEKSNQVNAVVAGYLGQGQLAASTRAMTEALQAGDAKAAERHRTEALEIAQAVGNRQMTQVLEQAGAGSEVARKTAALGTSTVSLTEEDEA
ncbi:MAG: VWA domain-containing protein [Chloroflexi bacterium]|uniref:vWA domain-containing protein n=2 Tax=Candidatus Flexifilum breve TaxID=3140694 RepID=UPI003135D5B9|nr:VWA domain-containing protein [Chloroflexota bacterium]